MNQLPYSPDMQIKINVNDEHTCESFSRRMVGVSIAFFASDWLEGLYFRSCFDS